MSEEKTITEEEAHTNPVLALPVQPDSELNMIAEILATDFPEFLFAIAEENFLRGYQQGLDDATTLHSPEEAGC